MACAADPSNRDLRKWNLSMTEMSWLVWTADVNESQKENHVVTSPPNFGSSILGNFGFNVVVVACGGFALLFLSICCVGFTRCRSAWILVLQSITRAIISSASSISFGTISTGQISKILWSSSSRAFDLTSSYRSITSNRWKSICSRLSNSWLSLTSFVTTPRFPPRMATNRFSFSSSTIVVGLRYAPRWAPCQKGHEMWLGFSCVLMSFLVEYTFTLSFESMQSIWYMV